MFSQPQTSLVLVTYVPLAVLNGIKSVCTSQITASWEAVPQSFPHSYGFGISLAELSQLPPADGTSTFPLQEECEERWEQPQIRLCASTQQLGDTKGRMPQSVLSATLNHSNSHCEGCAQHGSSAAEVFIFG